MSGTLDRSSGNGKSATAESVDLSPARIMQLGLAFRAAKALLSADQLRRDQNATDRFAQVMTGASLPAAWALSQQFTWGEYGTFVDFGTAEGAVPVEIVRAQPLLSGAGFDLPEMQPVFDAYVGRHGVADRVRFHVGDFFKDALPSTP